MGLKRLAWLTLLCAPAFACQSPRTELLVVTDTDLTIPAQTDAFRVIVSDPGGREQIAVAHFGDGYPDPPRTVGIIPSQQRLGPYLIEAQALRGGTPVVVREAEVTLVREQTLVLELHLSSSCISVFCPDRQTCADGVCRDVMVSAEELLEYTDPGAPDGGAAGGDAGGECGDTDSDPDNCGACGVRCEATDVAAATCAAGVCGVESCAPDTADCDGDFANGCETDLTNRNTCGSCDTRCQRPTRDCCDGACC